ncbi:hypothetical protein GCM10011400_11990 [Paraburkholderia caffeinilytica]|uniref:Transposase n=1 Tax=Paraburkholderia caffeinilytica TaxID=1761016 RepID=A0ABQ1LNB9_9BURK|nr:hypothetical protein GCM10011400_11990 [Paraburkholderia caffeinilytica]
MQAFVRSFDKRRPPVWPTFRMQIEAASGSAHVETECRKKISRLAEIRHGKSKMIERMNPKRAFASQRTFFVQGSCHGRLHHVAKPLA